LNYRYNNVQMLKDNRERIEYYRIKSWEENFDIVEWAKNVEWVPSDGTDPLQGNFLN